MAAVVMVAGVLLDSGTGIAAASSATASTSTTSTSTTSTAIGSNASARPVIEGGSVAPSAVGALSGSTPVAPDLPIAGSAVGAASVAGTVLARGSAGFYGSLAGKALNKPIVGMAPTPDGHGYWLVASDGGIFTYGDAHFYGSAGGEHLTQPVIALAAVPSGGGYWMAEGGSRQPPAPFPSALLANLASRQGVLSASVVDLSTGRTYNYRPGQLGLTASIVKVEILGTLLSQAQKAHRGLTPGQRSLARSMIEFSDNSSATALWDQ